MDKMTVEEIKDKFDNRVDYYSNAEAGQENMPQAGKVLTMMMEAMGGIEPAPAMGCDIGCGAGNFAVRLNRQVPGITLDLVDLSMPMLERAVERLSAEKGTIGSLIQGDIRKIDLPENTYDIVVSGAALHHLREEKEWQGVFSMIYRSLKPGGSFWYWDLIDHDSLAIRSSQYQIWGEHLIQYRDKSYRDYIFSECAREDSPRSIPFIIDKMTAAGFQSWDIIHKSSLFASMVAFKGE